MTVAVIVALLVFVYSVASSFAARKRSQLAVPNSVDFGSVAVGTSGTQSLTVTNMAGSPISITAASAAGAGFSYKAPVLPLNLQPGQSITVSASFLPAD